MNDNEIIFNLNHTFRTKAEITDRTIMVAEAFGLGVDDEKEFILYDHAQLKINPGDIIYITGDSGSGKSWVLNNIFARLPGTISISDLKIKEDELVVEGIGKNLQDALMKLNIAGLGDAFLYLRKYSQLSDGQKYRYRIAKFIDREDKKIWILDEFAATLDRTTAKIVAYNLQKIARKLGKTVVIATTHTDLLKEIRPNILLLKGYESTLNIKYYTKDYWKNRPLEFYKDMRIQVGSRADYELLKKFHYRQAHLGALKQIYSCTYKGEVVGVIVICYPFLALKGRNIALNNKLARMTQKNCKYINKNIDYIARVILHPKFRGIGLSQYMLREYFKLTEAKYAETLAAMGNFNPFFERVGMTRIDIEADNKRTELVKQLEEYGYNISLLSSVTYNKVMYSKLNWRQKNKVREIVKNILQKYKGQIPKLLKINNIDDILKENLFELMKELNRANTVYLIKKLR